MTTLPARSPCRVAAYLTPLCVLPSGIWRIHQVFWVQTPACAQSGGTQLYVVALSLVTVAAAALTIGLVSRWGEVIPRWVPVLGGREVPVRWATAAAMSGALVIFFVYGYAALNPVFHWREPVVVPGCPPPDQGPYAWIAYLAYGPVLLWGPLLVVATIGYYRRRTAANARISSQPASEETANKTRE